MTNTLAYISGEFMNTMNKRSFDPTFFVMDLADIGMTIYVKKSTMCARIGTKQAPKFFYEFLLDQIM